MAEFVRETPTTAYEFELCNEDGCANEATYIGLVNGQLVFYCENHGPDHGLQHGLPDFVVS